MRLFALSCRDDPQEMAEVRRGLVAFAAEMLGGLPRKDQRAAHNDTQEPVQTDTPEPVQNYAA